MKDRVVVFVVNTRPEPLQNVTISPLDENEAQLTRVRALTEKRDLKVHDKILWKDDFDGYGVHIYETDIYFNFMRRYYQKPGMD